MSVTPSDYCNSKGEVEAQELALRSTTSPTPEQRAKFITLMFPSELLEANPNYENYVPMPTESVTYEIMQKQLVAAVDWVSTNLCDDVSNITQPRLIIVGTEDAFTPAANSLIISEKVPGAWLIPIRGAGYGLMYQYPEQFPNILMAFLENTRPT